MMDWTLFVSLMALVAATISALFAYLNHRATVQAREQSELPKIGLYGSGGDCHFRLETDHNSIGWKIVRVEVVESDPSKCLQQNLWSQADDGSWSWVPSEWRDFCEYPEGASDFEPISFHPACSKASLEFICEIPARTWWIQWRKKRKRVPYKYVIGGLPPLVSDSYLTGIMESP